MENNRLGSAAIYAVGAAIVFGICSAIQALGDSNMFSGTFRDPGNWFLELLINVTFYPGWMLTLALLLGAGKSLMSTEE